MDIIEPCGFPLTAKALRRSVMDYGNLADVHRIDSWESFLKDSRQKGERLVLFTTKGSTPLTDFSFQSADRLIFGRESSGVPAEVYAACDAHVVIPLAAGARSINIATAAAIGLFEALRQTGGLNRSAK